MDNTKLSDCPFCGNEAGLSAIPHADDCYLSVMFRNGSIDECNAAWNRRATDAPAQGEQNIDQVALETATEVLKMYFLPIHGGQLKAKIQEAISDAIRTFAAPVAASADAAPAGAVADEFSKPQVWSKQAEIIESWAAAEVTPAPATASDLERDYNSTGDILAELTGCYDENVALWDLADRVRQMLAAAPATAAGSVPDDDLYALLPGSRYMDPPDGGDVPLIEQLRRMAKDAERYRWTRDEGCNFVWAEIGAGNFRTGLDTEIDKAIARISPVAADAQSAEGGKEKA